ncbi:MAG: hypothetical protein C0434_04935 [Xanthomonadaceae bacterium]|nr:hypothetical protein [Xanthomonadaceae bacterium]
MLPMTNTWWVLRTGQRWKLAIALILAGIMAALFLAMIKDVNSASASDQDMAPLFGLGFVGAGVAFFVWLAFAIKCQRCGYGVVFKLMRRNAVNEWNQKLLTATVCPICGDEGNRA